MLQGGSWVPAAFSGAEALDPTVPYQVLHLELATPVIASGIRVRGHAGGADAFVTLSELDALSAPMGDSGRSFDLNGNGVIDVDDLHDWHATPIDLNADGQANAADREYLERAVRWRERTDMEQTVLRAANETRTWMWVCGGALIIGAVSCLSLWLGGRGRHRRLAGEVKALRARIDALEQPRNRVREAAPPPPAPIIPVPTERIEEEAPPTVLDPEVLAHVRKRAPERLATFREARARGDWEKAVRVVHTLKPLLTGLDEARFAPLCARLVAEGEAGTSAWQTNADALEAALDGLPRAS